MSLFKHESEEKPKSIWCVVAQGADLARDGKKDAGVGQGTKRFPPGTKVYCFKPQPGDKSQSVKVTGRQHGSHEHTTMVVPTNRLTNWRAQIVYTPEIIEQMAGCWSSNSEGEAEQLATAMANRQAAQLRQDRP